MAMREPWVLLPIKFWRHDRTGLSLCGRIDRPDNNMGLMPNAIRDKLVQRATIIDRILAKKYGAKIQHRLTDPTSELILTILSQNTNDTIRDRAYESLKSRFPEWSDVAAARSSQIAKAIEIGGLAVIKSKRIKKILTQIAEKSSDYNLSFLETMSDQQVWDYLISFIGVGPKTVACVLLFSLGRNTMPVDTHVLRVGKRLNLIPDNYNAEKAHRWFLDLGIPLGMYQLHLNLISHGRALCRPRNPKCIECPLKRYCLYYQKSTVK
jgi:endonuclease III